MKEDKKSQLATDQKAKHYERKTDKQLVSVIANEDVCTVLIQDKNGIQSYRCYPLINTKS